MKQPCIDCGRPSDATRCTQCGDRFTQGRYRAQGAARKQAGGRPQYGGQWSRVSKAVRATATVCWICGERERTNDPWQADHVLPARTHGGIGPVRAAHRSCNIARSNKTRGAHP